MARKRNKVITLARTSIERNGGKPAPEPDLEPPEVSIVQPTPRPIDESLKRGRLTATQHAAADSYFKSLVKLDRCAGPRTVDYSREHYDRPKNLRYAPADYRLRRAMTLEHLNATIRERLSALHFRLMIMVVCDELPAAAAARKLGIPARNGIGLLRECLDLLAELYGLQAP